LIENVVGNSEERKVEENDDGTLWLSTSSVTTGMPRRQHNTLKWRHTAPLTNALRLRLGRHGTVVWIG